MLKKRASCYLGIWFTCQDCNFLHLHSWHKFLHLHSETAPLHHKAMDNICVHSILPKPHCGITQCNIYIYPKRITSTPARQSTNQTSSSHKSSAKILLILLYMFFENGRIKRKQAACNSTPYQNPFHQFFIQQSSKIRYKQS